MANAQLSREERAQIERLSEKLGDAHAAATLLVHPATLSRALARRQLRSSTVQCLRSRLRELEQSELQAS
jgi:IS30 family transposase